MKKLFISFHNSSFFDYFCKIFLPSIAVLLPISLSASANEPELTWTSPNAKVPFANPHSACAHSLSQYCSYVPGSGCVSSSPGGVTVYANGGRPYAACGGTVTHEWMDGDERRTRTMSSTAWDAVYSSPMAYVAVVPEENPPPQQCAGNPIEIGTGVKLQRETDVASKSLGGLEFTRFYSSATIDAEAAWSHNYKKSLRILDSTKDLGIQYRSAQSFADKNSACVSGWGNIKSKTTASWTVGTTASLKDGLCQIKQGDIVIRNIPLIKDMVVETSAQVSGAVNLLHPNGSIYTFVQHEGGYWAPTNGTGGLLQRLDGENGWRLTAGGVMEDYSADGRLQLIKSSNGAEQKLFYEESTGLLTRVLDSTGRSLDFHYDENARLTSLTVDLNKTIIYDYHSNGLVSRVGYPQNINRIYHYENSQFIKALTGITDERGIRYATWGYDGDGRAILSEHAGGSNRTVLAFNGDGSTTVTNALGKNTVYHFSGIAGARRVTKVEGQPTEYCAGANQEYTYNSLGLLISKTDWAGNKTVYSYNAQGQEISRTEAHGTSVERTITSEWHPTLNVKIKLTEPGLETVFNYDDDGRLLSKATTSLSQ